MIPSPSSYPPLFFLLLKREPFLWVLGEASAGDWARQGQTHPEYEAERFRNAFRLSK